jgi:hypothetical protein
MSGVVACAAARATHLQSDACRGGIYAVTLVATEPAGNFATTSGAIVVSRH